MTHDDGSNAHKKKTGNGGYCDPPVKHQWKSGQSGNPGGRPKGQKSLAQHMRDEGHEEAIYKEGETVKKTLKAVMVSKTLHQKAMKGDLKAIELLFMIDQSIKDEAKPTSTEPLPAEDQAILARAAAKRGWAVQAATVGEDWVLPVTGELRYELSVDGTLTFELMPFEAAIAAALAEDVDRWVEGQTEGFVAQHLIEFIFDWIKRRWVPSAPALEPHRFAVREMVTSILTKADGTVIVSHAGDLA